MVVMIHDLVVEVVMVECVQVVMKDIFFNFAWIHFSQLAEPESEKLNEFEFV